MPASLEMDGSLDSSILPQSDPEDPAPPARVPRRFPHATAAAVGVLGTATLVCLLLGFGGPRVPQHGLLVSTNVGAAIELEAREELPDVPSADYPDPCAELPFVRLEKLKHSNLGGKGPDDGAEGIVYEATVAHAGRNGTVEVHLNATSEYQPAWPKENGIRGRFGAFNVKHGTNVSLTLTVHDPESGEQVPLPKFALTFFDLDQGRDGHSVEHVTASGFKEAWLSNETEVNRTDNDDGSSTFRASVEGNGDDNPTNPLVLTTQQKNRAVTLTWDDMHSIPFTVGASEGKTARVFQFVIRPSLLCAYTFANGTILNATGLTSSPIIAVRSGSPGQSTGVQAILLAVGLLSVVKQQIHL